MRGVARRYFTSQLILPAALCGVVFISLLLASLTKSSTTSTPTQSPSTNPTKKSELNQIIDDEWEYVLKSSPEFATFVGDNRYNDKLSDLSISYFTKQETHMDSVIASLDALDQSKFSDDDKLNFEIFRQEHINEKQNLHFKSYLLALDQMNGIHTTFPQLMQLMLYSDPKPKDFRDWISRLRAFPTQIDQTIALLTEGLRIGMTPPRDVMKDVVGNMNALLNDKTFWISPFQTLSATDPIRTEGIEVVESIFVPAWTRLRDFVQQTYIPNCRTTYGILNVPNGLNLYNALIQMHTTLNKTPQEIHNIGLSEVARIETLMNNIVSKLNISGVSNYAQLNDWLETSPALSDSKLYAQSREEFLDFVSLIGKKLDPLMTQLFGKLPRCPWDVLSVPEYEEKSAPAAYYFEPDSECTRPGQYFVNTGGETLSKFSIVSTTLHESVPGHHLQLAIQNELDIPNFRKFGGNNAYSEGWALYAESLGYVIRLYEGQLFWQFGQLDNEMFRAVRLVVDTGMHAMNWTRQQAIDYLSQRSSMSIGNVVIEIDRYLVWPGQALAYKLGELHIKGLKEDLSSRLGENFNLRKFHDAVLEKGTLPLELLTKSVNSKFSS